VHVKCESSTLQKCEMDNVLSAKWKCKR